MVLRGQKNFPKWKTIRLLNFPQFYHTVSFLLSPAPPHLVPLLHEHVNINSSTSSSSSTALQQKTYTPLTMRKFRPNTTPRHSHSSISQSVNPQRHCCCPTTHTTSSRAPGFHARLTARMQEKEGKITELGKRKKNRGAGRARLQMALLRKPGW
jgi:hypothetical protein